MRTTDHASKFMEMKGSTEVSEYIKKSVSYPKSSVPFVRDFPDSGKVGSRPRSARTVREMESKDHARDTAQYR